MKIKEAIIELKDHAQAMELPTPDQIRAVEFAISVLEKCEERKLKEVLTDCLAEAQVETIPNSAIYDVDVKKLAQSILSYLTWDGE